MQETPKWVVYGLKVEGSSRFRYVGKTTVGAVSRLRRHMGDARRGASTRRVVRWINSVEHSTVVSVVLEVCPEGDKNYLNYAEKYWIASLKELGHDLTNHTVGGDGTTGHVMTEESKRRMSLATIGRYSGDKNPMYGVRGELHPMFGKTGDNHPGIVKIREKTLSRVWSAEGRERLSISSKRPKSEEMKAKLRVPKSEETKLKLKHAQHLNYHVNRGILNERCCFCIPSKVSE